MFFITAALMVGTAGLPHVIVRFYTVPRAAAARVSAGFALLFIALLYTTAPAVAAFARTNLLVEVSGTAYDDAPAWFKNWESTGLIKFEDRNGDGTVVTLQQQWLEADTERKTYRVAAGTRWSTVIARLDALGFSPAVMQSNNDFGVASTFSVNAHGWPVPFSGCGSTVREITMVLADGSVVTCSRDENADLPNTPAWADLNDVQKQLLGGFGNGDGDHQWGHYPETTPLYGALKERGLLDSSIPALIP